MSVQGWDMPNDNGNTFNNTIDPSMAFAGGTPTTANFDFASMQNPQISRMQNGTMRNGTASPGFNPSMYQSQQVIPAKRQHEFTGSPKQASRSQTPQQGAYPGYTGANGQPPTAYAHLQHANSSGASPSPVMPNQQFNPSAIPQRMSTASPSPYSPAGQSFVGAQASPVQSEYSLRAETPANANQAYMANGGQSYSPQPGTMMPGYGANGVPGYTAGMTQEQQNAQRSQYARQLQVQQNMMAQQRAAQAQQQAQMGGMPAGYPNQIGSQQGRMLRQAVMAYQAEKLKAVGQQPEAFASTVAIFNQQRGLPFQKMGNIAGRTIHSALIFITVAKAGGSKKLTVANGWPQICAAIDINPQHVQELKNFFDQNLAAYEPTWQQAMQAGGTKAMQQQAMGGNQGPSPMAAQMQANRAMQYSQEQMAAMQARKQSSPAETPMKPPQQANGMSPPSQNTPGPSSVQATAGRTSASVEPKQEPDDGIGGARALWTTPLVEQIGETFTPLSRMIPHPDDKFPNDEVQEHHGGLMLGSSVLNLSVANMTRVRPEHPRVDDLGNLEMHALLLSLKSGLPGEVRLALDTISNIVWEPTMILGPNGPKAEGLPSVPPGRLHPLQLDFKNSGDLVEALADCGEAQLDLLVDNIEMDDYTDTFAYLPVEEIARETMTEINSLQDIPDHGSIDYELEQCAEKLLVITTILRNLTETSPFNRHAVADASVVKLMANIIKHLGTRHLLFRTYRNTFDFCKDAIIYFSAVASDVVLTSKDEALWILHFLLSFAPPIQQVHDEDTELYFPSYMRGSHKYLPFAIQTLAKLLASGDPNRAYLKSVFAADLAAGSSPDLLTRAFGMCISPLPGLADDIYPKIRSRATFLTQGLLAADGLVALIPSTENSLARAWLCSEDGFAERLLRIIAKLSIDFQPQRIDDGHDMVQEYGTCILRKLAERAKDAESNVGQLSAATILKKSFLTAAMSGRTIDERSLQHLIGYLSLDV